MMKTMMKRLCGAALFSGCIMMTDNAMNETSASKRMRIDNGGWVAVDRSLPVVVDRSFDDQVLYYAKNGVLFSLWFRLDNSANPNACDKDGSTALMYAAATGRVDIVRLLLVFGADIDAQNSYGDTALIVAAINGHETVVQQLLAHDARVNVRPPVGDIMALVVNTNSIILSRGAAVNIQNKKGLSALMWAAVRGYAGIVRMLLDAGADTDLVDTKDQATALAWAQAHGKQEVVQVFKDYLAARLAAVDKEWHDSSSTRVLGELTEFLDDVSALNAAPLKN